MNALWNHFVFPVIGTAKRAFIFKLSALGGVWGSAPILLLLLLPGIPPFWLTLANYIGIAAIVVIGLVVLTGFGGMTSFGQATFMGFGAYASALLTTQLHLSPWLGLPAALLVSLLGALAVGAIALRLSGHFLALATLAWAVSFSAVFGNLDLFGRNDGVQGIPPLSLWGLALTDGRSYLPVVWIAVVLALLAAEHLLDSRVGRAIRSLRGAAAAASACGADVARLRLLAFVFAGGLAGLAGWLYAHLQRSVNPSPFGVGAGIDYLLMAVVGGAGSLGGALFGAGLVTLVNDRLQDVLPRLLGTGGDYQTIVFGCLLVLVLQVAPLGLWPLLTGRRPRRRRIITDAATLPRRPQPPPGTPVLQAEGLRKTFGGLVAVADLRLTLAAGEITALIGPNGAGKSTSFDLLTGATRPAAGRVRFLGQDITFLPPRAIAAAGIARSFQHVKLVADMTVIENVAIGAHLRERSGALAAMLRLDRAAERRIFAEAARQLARVGLAEQAERPAGSLALGQQRIVEIARALCLDPVLLLLDEPAAGLRLGEKQALAALLRQLRAEGLAVLLVEHDMGFVMGLADRVVVMDFGTCLAEGAPEAIRRNPAVIAAYLGVAA